MKLSSGNGRRVWLLGQAVVVVIAIAVISLMFFGVRLYQESISLKASPHDNVQWTVSRLQIELLRLQSTLRDKESPNEDVRKRFDVFYSRVILFRDADLLAPLRADPETSSYIEELTNFLTARTPTVDGPDEVLSSMRANMAEELDELGLAALNLSLRANTYFSQATERRLVAFETLILVAALLAIALIVILIATLIVLWSRTRLANRKHQEAAVNGARLEAIVKVALDPIVVADASGKLTEFNSAAENVFGYQRDDVMGKEMADLFIPEDQREAHRAGMERYQNSGNTRVVGKGRLELEAVRKSGEHFPIELAVGEAHDIADEEPFFVGFIRDISQRKQTDKELIDARDSALAADLAKSQFIAVMSHEIRTPLNGVLGVLDLLSDTTLDEHQAEYVEVATRSGEILLHHINDVLDITRIESVGMEIAQSPFSLSDVLEEVASVARPRAAKEQTTIDVNANNVPKLLIGDADRIKQILLNLVGNAVKFTKGGKICLAARVVQSTDAAVQIELAVEDDGTGIAEENLSRIFDDFVTLDPSYNRKVEGSGLGLAISKRIASAMGGEIRVESALGHGSRFWFRLFLLRSEGTVEDTAVKIPQSAVAVVKNEAPKSVLLVEDNEVNRLVARRMLEAQGCSVVEAFDGLEGVAVAAKQQFDLIIMDISMPKLDGIEATKRIKRDGANRSTKIIGLTAHAAPKEQASFIAAGMEACIVKPLRRNSLLQVLGGVKQKEIVEDIVLSDHPIIDEEVFDEFVAALPDDTMRTILARVIGEFDEAATNLGKQDPDALASFAHKTAGAAALVGATRVHSALGSVETLAKRGGGSRAEIDTAIDELRNASAILSEFGA